MLSSLKNLHLSNKNYVVTKNTKITKKIIKLLYKEKCISAYENCSSKLKIYSNPENSINLVNAKIFSSGTVEKSVSYIELCKLSIKHKILVISTSHGVLTSFECKKHKSGGKLLFVL